MAGGQWLFGKAVKNVDEIIGKFGGADQLGNAVNQTEIFALAT